MRSKGTQRSNKRNYSPTKKKGSQWEFTTISSPQKEFSNFSEFLFRSAVVRQVVSAAPEIMSAKLQSLNPAIIPN
tara:strand:- start:144 stop:368 length:225 start_codon:yes stop_codon:yes gene_type:complete